MAVNNSKSKKRGTQKVPLFKCVNYNIIMKNLFIILLLSLILLTSNIVHASTDKETLIILDQSASMLDKYRDSSKIHYAIKAVKSILNNLPDSENVGLRTVGVHPVLMFSLIRQNPNALCEATILLNEIKSNNRHNINNSLMGIMPSGASPLQYTLETAINHDFYLNTRLKHIILVTDGYENCDGDPCGYIRRIMMSRDDIKIDVVGIGLNSEDKNALGCLTAETKGQIFDFYQPSDILQITPQLSGVNPSFNTPTNTYNFQPVKHSIKKQTYLMEFYE